MEDNEAVIKTVIKGRSFKTRHTNITQKIDLDCIYERFPTEPGLRIFYMNTKFQIAHILTKGSFISEQWQKLCSFANVVRWKTKSSAGSDTVSPNTFEKSEQHSNVKPKYKQQPKNPERAPGAW